VIGDDKYQQSELTRAVDERVLLETFYRMEQENILLKAQRDELLAAAKPVYCLPLLYEDKRLAETYALRRLGEVIAMIEGRIA
jgi:hypothetical protein